MTRFVIDRLVELALLVWLLFLLAHEWTWFLLALAVGVPLIGVVKRKIAARREAERQRLARLIRHADDEHRMIQEGSLGGIYGDYPVPPALRGTGIWLCDTK